MHENYDLDLLLELVEQRKFRSLTELLSQMNEVDIAEFLDELDVEQEILVFRLLPKDTAAEVFTYLENTEDQEKLIGALSDRELREVLDELSLDDTVDIIEDMPELSPGLRRLHHDHGVRLSPSRRHGGGVLCPHPQRGH